MSTSRAILIFFASGALLLLILSGCATTKPASTQSAPSDVAVVANNASQTEFRAEETGVYLGNKACAPCHAAEFKSHKISGHNQTLAALQDASSAHLAPPLGEIPGHRHLISKAGGKVILSSMSRPDIKGELNFVMGSGNTGLTYLGISADKIAEAQYSYFPKVKKWYRTPGHAEKPDTALGQIYKGDFARKCVECHSTHMEADTLIPQKKFYGVGCEACHGPGSAHIEAMQKGEFSEGKMERLETAGAKKVIEVCQKCHTDQLDTTSITSRQVMSGMKQSKCFLQGQNTLSCITCHNPHTNVDRNIKTYESICLTCHATQAKPVFKGVAAVQGRVCKVNASGDCIRCHMPPTLAFADSPTPSKFADHYIRIRPEFK